MRNNLCADTLPAMLIPPGLFAVIGAEQPRPGFRGIGQFCATVLAARFTWGSVSGNADPAAIGLDGADRDAEGIRYVCISSLLLSHGYNLLFL